jgi:carbonic anhydrase
VPAQEIMGLKAGEVFVARNIANLVVNTDMSLLAVLEYAVHVLEVKDIFVVGHYQVCMCVCMY